MNKKPAYLTRPCHDGFTRLTWAVAGVDTEGGAGVLAWAYDRGDAKGLMREMKEHPEWYQVDTLFTIDTETHDLWTGHPPYPENSHAQE